MDKELLKSFYKSHRGGVNGAVVGLFIAVLILLVGFFKVLFIVMCMALGYYIGKVVTKEKDYIKKLFDRILPPGTYRWLMT